MIAKAETVRISEKLVRANLDCARKSFLLMFHRNQSKSTEYGTMLDKLRSSAIERYLSGHDVNGALNLNVLSAQNNWKVGDISTNQIVSKLLATENVFFEVSRNKSKVDEVSISPVIFPVSSTLRLEDKIELAFAAHVLDQSQKTKTLSGKVVLLGGEVKTIRLVDDAAKFRPITTILNGWLSSSSDPPPVVLNKHCANCEFQHLCRPIAEREDSLSLLARIGPKELARYAKKGIFTVKQLSFLYRPRKRNRRGKTPPVKHLY
ncbi:MAG: hypothetical protein LH481_11290, partial [Burkholderiales bacterium]|nr:hypothetical protein [Burkholderiales bacterium]